MHAMFRLCSLALAAAVLASAVACSNHSVGFEVDRDNDSTRREKARPLTRLFIQDLNTASLQWADVNWAENETFTLGPLATVKGFAKLDPEKHKLVQMKELGGVICVGVRDNDEGAAHSGWVVVGSGVRYVDHGDHGHWIYKKPPTVLDSRLDAKQGNPAHLYAYDGRFFLANDKLDGYTRIDPKPYREGKKDSPQFLVGGGNHITLAVVDDKVGYSCWIDGGGPNKGRVDVTPITGKARSETKYSFRLPSGGIHGAIANSGKVFFAPVEGICWVEADTALKRTGKDVIVNHLDLGKDGEKAKRTGAFVNHANYVLFVTGREANSELVLLDAKKATMKPIRIPLEVKKGTRALTPIVVETQDGKAYAFVFHDRAKDVEADDVLDVIALDPNKDGDCSDAKVVKTTKVGKSEVEGHFGHHDLAFDAEKRYGFVTNPGDGTVSVLSMKTLEVVATLEVGGKPNAVLAHGGLETDD